MMNNTLLIGPLWAFTFSIIKDPLFPFHNLIDLSSEPLEIIF